MFIIFIFILILFVISVRHFYSKIMVSQMLSDSLSNTISYHKAKLYKAYINNYNDNSFTLKLKTLHNKEPYFKEFTLFNNKEDKCMEAKINNLTINKMRNLSFNIFVKKDRLGLYFDNNNMCYTAKSKHFRSKWNNSVYGSLYNIPSFIPDSINYNKLVSLFSADKFLKTALAFSVGNIDVKFKEIINNIDILDMGTYPVSTNSSYKNDRLIRVKVRNDYLCKFAEDLARGSSNAYIDSVSDFFMNIGSFIKSSHDKYTVIDFVIQDNMIRSIETVVENQDICKNIILNITDNTISLTATDIKKASGSPGHYRILMIYDEKNNNSLIVTKSGDIVFTLNSKKSKDHITLTAAFKNMHDTSAYYAKLSNNTEEITLPEKEKSIYSISISDLYDLMKNFDI